MKRNGIDLITLCPLILLILLPVGRWVAPCFTHPAVHTEIAVLKYFSIPLLGFSIGSVLFLGIIRNDWKLPASLSFFIEQRTKQLILLLVCIFLIYLSSLAVLRYTTLHTFVFDMGRYDQKIWRISVAPLAAVPLEVSLGHFQPILFFHALIYKVIDSPIIIQAIQAIVMVSGVLPLFLLAKEHLYRPPLVLLVVVIYLWYPPVDFNAALDFHPDHLYVPLLLWAFYFSEKGNYWKGILLAGLGATVKDPYILGAAFFGLYLILAKKRYLAGSLMFFLCILTFFAVTYSLLQISQTHNQTHPLMCGIFPFVDITAEGIHFKFNFLLDTLLMWKAKKLLFIYFLLAPLLFLPLLNWKRFIPATPFIAIPLLSATHFHASTDSQYTAGVIAPAFVALVFSLKQIEDRLGVKYATAFATLALTTTLTFNIANGPSLLSINFWEAGWAEIWHKSAFTRGEHEDILNEVFHKIPSDPSVIVSSQGNINHARLAHRYEYWLFPHRWEDADYIILDTKRPLMVGDRIEIGAYSRELQKIENNSKFDLVFKKDGVLLYKRTK